MASRKGAKQVKSARRKESRDRAARRRRDSSAVVAESQHGSSGQIEIHGVAQWLALAEFRLPDEQLVEVIVSKVGLLLAPLLQLEARGIRPALLVPSQAGVHLGVLPTVTLQGEPPQMLRLPLVLGAWVVECCELARQGSNPMPSRVRFRRVGDGVEVTYLPPIDSADERVGSSGDRRLTVYVDESGNSGDAATPAKREEFDGQHSFALAGVSEEQGSGVLADLLQKLRTKHGIRAVEVKSRTMGRYPGFVADLLHALDDGVASLFIELVDKEFFLGANFVTFMLGGPVLDPSPERARVLANEFAEVVTAELGAALRGYAAFARAPSRETFGPFRDLLIAGLSAARGRTSGRTKALLKAVEELVQEPLRVFEERGDERAAYRFLLPPPDRNPRGEILAMLPHVSAFTNLFGRVNRYSAGWSKVEVVHDKQEHFEMLLRDYAASLASPPFSVEPYRSLVGKHVDTHFLPEKFSLAFEDSRSTPGIQVADVVARFCTRRLNAVMTGTAEDGANLATLLARWAHDPLGVGLNIVSTDARVARFFGGQG